MKLLKNGVDLSSAKMIYNNTEINKLIYQGELIYERGGVPSYFPRSQINLGVIGDSTIAAGYGGLLVPAYIPQFTPITSIAQGGDTIQGQRSKFSSMPNKDKFDVFIMQVGLNDMSTLTQTTATVLANYQSMINEVRAAVNPNCKIYAGQMLPARQRSIDVRGEELGQLSYERWLELNYAMEHTFTGLDGCVSSHVAILNDGLGNLKPEYDTGDHIHENVAGRIVIANAWRNKLIEDNLLSV